MYGPVQRASPMKAKASNLTWGRLQVNVFNLGRERILSSADDFPPRRDWLGDSVNIDGGCMHLTCLHQSCYSRCIYRVSILLAVGRIYHTVLQSVLLFSLGLLKLINITASAGFTPRLPAICFFLANITADCGAICVPYFWIHSC